MRNILLAIAFILFCISLNAQTFQVIDLQKAVGFWEGKLTYLDYSSGKPFTMLANIQLSLTQDKKGYITSYEYPKEPHANSKDTIYVFNKLFGKDNIVEFKKDEDGDFKFVTEIVGVDGNDHKKAVLRYIYLLNSNFYSISKEVKFDDSDKWIKRNEYILNRISN